MNNLKIEFPKTDIIGAQFTFKTGNTTAPAMYNDLGRLMPTASKLKTYYYRLPQPLVGNVHVGDMVVVFCQTGYQVCEISEINVTTGFDTKDMAWVVDTVSLQGFVAERERVEQMERMKQHIIKEKKRLEAQVTFDLIAEKNPEFSKLLASFREAGGEL